MNDKQQPDKANPLDGDLNVPAFESKQWDKLDVFARTGRAEPQEIRPQKQEETETEVLSNPAANGFAPLGNQQSTGEDTAVLDLAATAETEGFVTKDAV